MSDNIVKVPDNLPDFLNWLKERGIEPSKYRFYIDRFLENKSREKNVPLYGNFELTPLCNFDCKMCYVHLNKNQMDSPLIELDALKSVVREAYDMGMKQVSLTGGECLTYPYFDDFYLFLHSCGIEVCVFTNGLLLDEKRIEFFKAHPPKVIQITLYGSNEETYEKVTGHRAFSKVYSNILNAKNAGLTLQIAITPNKFMGDDGDNIVRMAIDLHIPFKINYCLLDPLENTGRHGQEQETSLNRYVSMNKIHAEAFNYEIAPVDAGSLPDIGSENSEKEYGVTCGAGRSLFNLDWKGVMHPCGSLYKICAYPLRDGFETAWKQINDTACSYPRPVECSKCSYKKICMQCIALHEQGADKGHANPYVCERTRRMVEEGLLKLD